MFNILTQLKMQVALIFWRRAIVSAGLMFMAVMANAQNVPDLTGPVKGFLEGFVEPLFPLVLGGVFLWTAVSNIGMINDANNRDWKGYLSKIGIFAVVAAVLVIIYKFLVGLAI